MLRRVEILSGKEFEFSAKKIAAGRAAILNCISSGFQRIAGCHEHTASTQLTSHASRYQQVIQVIL